MVSGASPVTADVHHIVRNQLMAAFDQLQGCFAFPDPAVPRQHDADAVHIQQHPVDC